MVLYDLYIIHNAGGRCIHHYKFAGLRVNSDLVCPFLDALSTFAMEAIPSKGQMRLLDRGDVKIVFEQGKYVTLALFSSEGSVDVRGLLSQFLFRFEQNYTNALEKWDGSLETFNGLEDLVESVFKREKVSRQTIPSNMMPKPISIPEVAGSRIGGQDAVAVVRAAVQDGVSGILSITLNPLKFEPVGYISILKGKGYAALYTKPGSRVRRGADAVKHIMFDSLTFPAWIRFRIASDDEVESETDATTNRIDVPLYKITLDALLLRHHYDEIKNLKPKSKQFFSPEELQNIRSELGDAAVNVLKTSTGNVTSEQLAIIHGLSPLEVTEIFVWTSKNGLTEMVKS